MISFSFAGVRWRASFGFFAAVAAFLFLDAGGFALSFLLAAALHELGHLAVMALVSAPVRRVELSATGLRVCRGGRLGSGQELAVLAAGAGANLAAALLLYLAGSEESLRFSAANTALAFFHLLPLRGLDGGSMLELLLLDRLGPDQGNVWSRRLQLCFAAAALLGLGWATVRYGFSMSSVLLALVLLCALLAPG